MVFLFFYSIVFLFLSFFYLFSILHALCVYSDMVNIHNCCICKGYAYVYYDYAYLLSFIHQSFLCTRYTAQK